MLQVCLVKGEGLWEKNRALCEFTFGKALGCHGAVICGTKTLKDYLINFARPFIYTTSCLLIV